MQYSTVISPHDWEERKPKLYSVTVILNASYHSPPPPQPDTCVARKTQLVGGWQPYGYVASGTYCAEPPLFPHTAPIEKPRHTLRLFVLYLRRPSTRKSSGVVCIFQTDQIRLGVMQPYSTQLYGP